MLNCQILFGLDRGREVQALYEQATGAECPCRVGLECPLMPDEASRRPLRVIATGAAVSMVAAVAAVHAFAAVVEVVVPGVAMTA